MRRTNDRDEAHEDILCSFTLVPVSRVPPDPAVHCCASAAAALGRAALINQAGNWQLYEMTDRVANSYTFVPLVA